MEECIISESRGAFGGFDEILDQLDYTVLVTDYSGMIEYVNQAFERVTGYGRDEVVGRTPRFLSDKTLPATVYEDIWRGLRGGIPRRSTFRNRRKTGETYDEETSISVIRDSHGEISRFIWFGKPAERPTTIELFGRLANSSPSGIVVLKGDRIYFANEQFKRATGYEDAELFRLAPLQLVHPEDRELVRQRRSTHNAEPYEYRLVSKDSRTRWVLESIDAVDFLNLDTAYTAATIVDISDRKAAEEKLHYALTAYAATLESTTDGLVVIDMDKLVRHINRRFCEMWGLREPSEYIDQPGAHLLADMLPQIKDAEKFSELGRRVFRSDQEIDDTMEVADGRTFEVHTKPQIIEGAVAGQVWSFRDVTEHLQLQFALVEMANHDSLTGLLGRNYFQEQVNRAISRGEHGAVLFMDVDDFKTINDSLGHSAGDELLRSLARCLSRQLRHDDLLARLGGDEFAALLRGANRSQARRVAQRLLRAVQEMKSVSADQPFASTISIGAALFPAHGGSVDELLGHADMAMYQVKQSGRNGLHFYRAAQGSKASSMNRMVWKQRILDALENDRFVLHAQPIYELSTGRLGCYELLLRLEEPNGKLALPRQFLPIAEKTGLMQEIDAWVIRQSLAIAQKLSAASMPAKVAFNLSATAVGNPTILDLIKKECSRRKLEPGRVCIEITETALISDLAAARAFLSSLKSLGFLLSVDDFGAGFSSLSRLKVMPADYLKIDGSFVENVSRNREDRHFIRAIADLASGLGIGAVAESVQDAEAVEILIGLGVLNGQGDYLGPSVPVSEVLAQQLTAAA